jgi:hypothetical protein
MRGFKTFSVQDAKKSQKDEKKRKERYADNKIVYIGPGRGQSQASTNPLDFTKEFESR